MAEHGIERRRIDGHEALELTSTASGGISATYVPSAGMVCSSLTHRGAELLGQRGGLAEYVETRGTMGIPFLFPYANRLSADRFRLSGAAVDLSAAPKRVGRDPNGLAIHGLLAGAPEWQLVESGAGPGGAHLTSRLPWPGEGPLGSAFPFPHTVELAVQLHEDSLAIGTTVTASGDRPVPLSYGFHPYFTLPDVPRADWWIEAPVTEQVELDSHNLPTGERGPARIEPGPLGDRLFDDVYSGVPSDAVFTVAGGGRRIEVEFTTGFPIAVVYAPADDDVICYEPMTAPTNAMIDRPDELLLLGPGETHSTRWAVRVRES